MRKGSSVFKDVRSMWGGLLMLSMALWLYSGQQAVWATHAASVSGEIEGRPAPVFRRICQGGVNNGQLCNENSDCPGSTCFDRNKFNITVAILYNAPAGDITSIKNLISAASAALFDVTDGQAEIGQATIHNDAITSNNADLVIHPSTNSTWWQANSGHYRTGGFMEVSIDNITNPANQGLILAHEFVHLVFDARDEYESRLAGCGALNGSESCPDAGASDGVCLMDGNGSELCWGQADSSDLTDLTGGNHDPDNNTEQSVCRANRSCWDQVVWSWPSTFLKPTGAPDPNANGAVVNATNFIDTNDNVRVVLVLDESGSMDLESPKRMDRLKVAANDFVETAENGVEVGIVSYATDANTTSGRVNLAVSPLVANRANWLNAISGLTPTTRTNIGDGLEKAKDLIVAAGGVTANTYVVLMTDGLNNEPSPQATADADLQTHIDDLLASGIPVYVTCTGGDLGLQSQCAEIAAGTNGFNSDSSDAAQLPETFVDFQERITGHQSVDSVYGDFAKYDFSTPITFYVDEGSESVSFSLLWDNPQSGASMTVRDPDGNMFQTRRITQGRYTRIKTPVPGDWQLLIDPGANSSRFVTRAYVHNKINNFFASTRKASFQPNEEIYVYAFAKSLGGTITKEDGKIIARVTRPDGSTDLLELYDNGRDASGHGDDLGGDGIFTGVYTNTSLKGAYGFHLKLQAEDWGLGHDAHHHDHTQVSLKFNRELRVSAGVSDPNDVVTHPEDDPRIPPTDDDDCIKCCDHQHTCPVVDGLDSKRLFLYLYVIMVLLVYILFLVWRCCCRKKG